MALRLVDLEYFYIKLAEAADIFMPEPNYNAAYGRFQSNQNPIVNLNRRRILLNPQKISSKSVQQFNSPVIYTRTEKYINVDLYCFKINCTTFYSTICTLINIFMS